MQSRSPRTELLHAAHPGRRRRTAGQEYGRRWCTHDSPESGCFRPECFSHSRASLYRRASYVAALFDRLFDCCLLFSYRRQERCDSLTLFSLAQYPCNCRGHKSRPQPQRPDNVCADCGDFSRSATTAGVPASPLPAQRSKRWSLRTVSSQRQRHTRGLTKIVNPFFMQAS